MQCLWHLKTWCFGQRWLNVNPIQKQKQTPELCNPPCSRLAFLNTPHDATCVDSESRDLEFVCQWLSSVIHSTKWVSLKSTKAEALNPCNKLEIPQSLKITCSVVVILEHGSTRGLHFCIVAAYATLICRFNSVVSNLFMYSYTFEWLTAMVS